jgi:hypothetical protein
MFDSAQNPMAGRTTIAPSQDLLQGFDARRGRNAAQRLGEFYSSIRAEHSGMKPFRSLAVFFLAIMFGLVQGCAGTADKESTGDYINDSWITTLVKAALLEDPQVKATEVNVETFKGVVLLSGFVSSAAAMRQAVYVARTVTGVSSVKNDMRVK